MNGPLTLVVLLFSENGKQLCPDCKIELDPNVHKFCYGCGKTMQQIFDVCKKQGKDIYNFIAGKYLTKLAYNIFHFLYFQVIPFVMVRTDKKQSTYSKLL